MKAEKDEVSALMWLRSKSFSVPIILAYDFSKNNEINSPYIVESICSGRPAGQMYGWLCLQEKKKVLDAVADAIAQMKSTTFAHWGKLVSSSSNDLSAPKYRRGRVQDDLRLKACLSVEEEMTFTVRRRSYRSPPPDMEETVSMQRNYAEQLEEATAQMAEDPFFMSTASEDFSPYFRGLSPDNIILAKTDDGNWEVSTTCRDVWVMTETVAASPLSWLWGGLLDLPYLQRTQATIASFTCSISTTKSLSYHDPLTTYLPYLQLAPSRTLLVLGPERHELKKRYDSIMAKAMQKLYPRRHLKYYEQQTCGLGKWFRRLTHCEMFLVPLSESPDEDIDNFIPGWADYATIYGLATQSERLESEVVVHSDAILDAPPASESTSTALFPPPAATVDLAADVTEPSSFFETRLDTLCEDFGIPLSITLLSTRDPGLTRFETGHSKLYNLRIGEDQDIKDELAIHLVAGTIVPVPRIIAYNATHISWLQKPYILYEAVGADGWRIQNTKYSSRSRLPLAEELASLTTTIAAKVLSCPGMLTAHPSMPDQGRSPVLGASIRTNIRPFFDHRNLVKPSLVGFISAMLNQQAYAFDVTTWVSNCNSEVTRAYCNLQAILKRMVSLGWLANSSYGDCVLVNTNTSAATISYTRPGATEQNDGVFKLNGVVSWKESVSLPKIFALPPPSWLWHVPISKGYRYFPPISKPTTTNRADREVMEHYDRVMGNKIHRILNIRHSKLHRRS